MLTSFAKWLRRKPQSTDGTGAEQAQPDGRLIWVQIGTGNTAETLEGVMQVLARLRKLRPGLAVMVALPPGPVPTLPDGVARVAPPADAAAAREGLGRHRPGLVVLFGNDLPVGLIAASEKLRIPVMMADVRLDPGSRRLGRFGQRGMLRRMVRILLRDQATLTQLLRQGHDPAQLEVGGELSRPAEPLRCSEAERSLMAALTHTRPVWLAVAVPQAEIPAVLAAQQRAQHHAHRMLLILAPDTPDSAEGLAKRLVQEGWAVTSRSVEGEPDAATEIFIADDPGDYGLWYRIAPVSYMGGTLIGAAGHARSPYEPAALGSAVIHGPQTAPFAADYARLDEARAARSIHDQTSLGEAVADLMSPDRAAVLAHNAWAVTSGGAAAAEAVVRAVVQQYEVAIEQRKT